MEILISGSSGFVGHHFVKRLLADGHNVTGVDKLFRPHTDSRFHAIVDDIRRYMAFYSADKFDLIVHCAATVGGRLNLDGDPLGVATNLSVDSEFWNWIAKSHTKKRVVYFSSSAIYPPELQTRRARLSLNEALVDLDGQRFALPETTYGFAKFAGELLAKQAVEHHGVEAVIYRPFGGYGETQDLTYPFPSIIQRVVNGDNPVIVWGSGEQERDFIHIDDVVEGVLSTYDKMPAGYTLNLGTGRGISFIGLAKLVCEIAGHKAVIEPDIDKPEGVFSRVSDPYEMEQWFTPRITLEEGIARALNALTPVPA